MRYDGPIIDAHTHLWDLRLDKHPWLRPNGDFGPKGRLDALKGRSYLIDDYRRDIAETPVAASVHVEALWDPDDDRLNETKWLERLNSSPFAARYVAGVTFGTDDTERDIRAQASFARVRGVRQVIAWTPHPDRRMVATADVTRDHAWRAAIPLLIDFDLHLELLLYPYQADNVVELARDFPGLTIVVNHIGSPIEQDATGITRWSTAVQTMATAPNVLIKLSAAAAYPIEKSIEAMSTFVAPVVREFGAERTMWGSDFPVGRLVGWSFPEYLEAYRLLLDEFSFGEQQDVLFGTANRVYRFGL